MKSLERQNDKVGRSKILRLVYIIHVQFAHQNVYV